MDPQQRIQQIEAFLDALIAGIQEAQQSGEVLSESFMASVADLIESEMAELQELRAQQSPADTLPPGTGAQTPEVPTADHPSSNIYGYQFDPETNDLKVKFMGKDSAESGPVYNYSNVGPHVFDIIKRGAIPPRTSGRNKYHEWFKGKTPSHGASVYYLLKQGGYNYQRVG